MDDSYGSQALSRLPAIGAFLVPDTPDRQSPAVLLEVDDLQQGGPNLNGGTDQTHFVVDDATDVLLEEVRLEIIEGPGQARGEKSQRLASLGRPCMRPRAQNTGVQRRGACQD